MAPKGGAPEGWGPEGWGPEGWGAQNFALFFSLSHPHFHFFSLGVFSCLFSSLWGSSREFWWCFGHSGPQLMCLFSPSGCPVEAPRGFTGQKDTRRSPKREKKNKKREILAGGGGGVQRRWGGPAEGGSGNTHQHTPTHPNTP